MQETANHLVLAFTCETYRKWVQDIWFPVQIFYPCVSVRRKGYGFVNPCGLVYFML